MKRTWAALLLSLWMFVTAGAAGEESGPGLYLKLMPRGKTAFTNVLLHYVQFDAEVRNAEKLTIRVFDPEGNQVAFRTRKHVDGKFSPSRSVGVSLKKGQTLCEGLNVLFQSGLMTGTWSIRVTASGARMDPVTESIAVEISEPAPLVLTGLERVHEMITGMDGGRKIPAEKGKIRYIAQDPEDSRFVKEYWLSYSFDLRETANQKCSRAVFSMALSWMGIDCTPVDMSDMLRARELDYTYDAVCRKMGTVTRVKGDLETLWAEYQAGRASPVLLHFKYGDAMHAVLLAARDEQNPEIFYAVTTGQRVNTSAFPGGMYRDPVLPLIIEEGKDGQRIQSPLLGRYHKGIIDQIWQWKATEEP